MCTFVYLYIFIVLYVFFCVLVFLCTCVPMFILYFASIFFGYLFRDLIVGMGTVSYFDVLYTYPFQNQFLEFEFIPWNIKLLPFFYKTKGTPVSSQGFLKFLFGSDIELEYPKKSMFIVGESEIGSESLKVIQDSFFYQVYSTLIRSDLPISVWRDLYKKYIHPGG